MAGDAFGATIKKTNGETLNGEILGRIVLKAQDETGEAGTRKTAAYVVILGGSVETIDGFGVNPVADATVVLVVHVYYGATPPETERTLRAAQEYLDETFFRRVPAVGSYRTTFGTTVHLQDGDLIIKQVTDRNLPPAPLIGELRALTPEDRKDGGPSVLITSIRVKTAEGVVSVPVEDIVTPIRPYSPPAVLPR